MPLASVTDITAWVTGFPLASVTTFPLESVTAITVSVTGFPLGSKIIFGISTNFYSLKQC